MYVTFNNGDGDMDSEFSGFYVIDGLLEGSKLVCIKQLSERLNVLIDFRITAERYPGTGSIQVKANENDLTLGYMQNGNVRYRHISKPYWFQWINHELNNNWVLGTAVGRLISDCF